MSPALKWRDNGRGEASCAKPVPTAHAEAQPGEASVLCDDKGASAPTLAPASGADHLLWGPKGEEMQLKRLGEHMGSDEEVIPEKSRKCNDVNDSRQDPVEDSNQGLPVIPNAEAQLAAASAASAPPMATETLQAAPPPPAPVCKLQASTPMHGPRCICKWLSSTVAGHLDAI